MTFLEEIFRFRGRPSVGGNPNRFIELIKGQEVFISYYEPDPTTFRSKYYYNARTNQLFALVNAQYWKKINEY